MHPDSVANSKTDEVFFANTPLLAPVPCLIIMDYEVFRQYRCSLPAHTKFLLESTRSPLGLLYPRPKKMKKKLRMKTEAEEEENRQ